MAKNTTSGMTRADMVAIIANRTGVDKTTINTTLDSFLDIIVEELSKGRCVKLTGFGTFENTTYKPRKLDSPLTKDTIKLEERVIPKFKPAKKVRDYVSKKVINMKKTTDGMLEEA